MTVSTTSLRAGVFCHVVITIDFVITWLALHHTEILLRQSCSFFVCFEFAGRFFVVVWSVVASVSIWHFAEFGGVCRGRSLMITTTVSSRVQLILSSNLYRKFKTLLQDLFSWYPVTSTQNLSWKNCTGFPFQKVLSIKSLVCVSVL